MSLPYGQNFDWTDAAVDRLRALFAEGLVFSAIAAQLSEEYGRPLTQNGAIGECYRLGLMRGVRVGRRPSSPRPSRSTPFRPNPILAPPIAPAAPVRAAEPPRCRPVDLLDLRNESCRWVVSGEGEPFAFCGAPEADLAHGAAYCGWHARMAYRRPGEQEAA